MATNEVHKQESTSNNETMYTEEDFNNVYKNEHVLNDKKASTEVRIQALIVTWGELYSLSTLPSKENLITLTEFLKSHTLNIVLSCNWMKFQDKYKRTLINSMHSCSIKFKPFKGFQLLCQKLIKISLSPWGNETLLRMLNCKEPVTEMEDWNFFVNLESGYFVSMRLKKLCEDKCEDMALNLTRHYLKCCEWADMNERSMCISDDQKKFVFDVYLALLYKLNYTSEMSDLLKSVTLNEGVDMVRRFAFKMVSASKIWENSIRIAQFSGTIFLTRNVVTPLEESSECINELLDIWLPTYDEDDDLDELVSCLRKIIKNALTAPHIYLFVPQLTDKFGEKLRTYNVEILIQALNTDLNLLEKLKTDNETERVAEITNRVAEGLLDLSRLLADNVNVSRECVLSAFSLNPTKEYLKKIEELARSSGYEVLDTGQWDCEDHPPHRNEDLLILCNKCDKCMSELKLSQSLQQPNTSLTEALKTNNMGLSDQLCDDLVVIIFCARYQLLSWLQNWDDLQRLCVMYLKDPVQTKNLITELKFVEIDYTPFLLKQEEESALNYEHFEQELFYDETNRKKKRRRLSSFEGDDFRHNPPPKSDPETLKTLRSFRRDLKRDLAEPRMPEQECSWYYNSAALQNPTRPVPLMQARPHEEVQYRPQSRTPFMQNPLQFMQQNPFMNSLNMQQHLQQAASYMAQQAAASVQQAPQTQSNDEPNQSKPAGLQIRRDIYESDDRYNFYQAVVQVNNESMLNTNFSQQPVIQGSKSLSSPKPSQMDVDQNKEASEPMEVEGSLDNGADIITEMNVDEIIGYNIENNINEEYVSTDFERQLLRLPSDDMECYSDIDLSLIEKNLFNDSFLEKNDISIEVNSNNNNIEQPSKSEEIVSDPKQDCINIPLDDGLCKSTDSTAVQPSKPVERNEEENSDAICITLDSESSNEEDDVICIDSSSDCSDSRFANFVEDNDFTIANINDDCVVAAEELVNHDNLPVSDTSEIDLPAVIREASVEKSDKSESVNGAALTTPKMLDLHSAIDNLFPTNDNSTQFEAEHSCSDAKDLNTTTVDSHKTVDSDKKVKISSQNLINYKEKFNLRECSVMLKGMDEPIVRHLNLLNKKPLKYKRKNITKRRKRRIKSEIASSSENKDENYNSRYSSRNTPLQIKNPRVVLSTNNCLEGILEKIKQKLLDASGDLNPLVVLNRLEDSCVNSLLARVPGIADTQLFRPDNTDQIVNVVQIAGGRATSTVQAPNTQTSTQVSPHIQRIGQPRTEKNEQASSPETTSPNITKPSSNPTITKPASTQSPTLINILSQQVIRPSLTTTARTRTGPLINILSQQTIKTANTTTTIAKTTTTTVTSDSQGNNATRIIATSSEQQHILNQIVNPNRAAGPLKTVVGTSTSEQGRIVQFICKSTDGKLIPVTSFPSNRLVKVGTTQAVTSTLDSPSVVEENFQKTIQTKKTDSNEISETLPKFQQAFGKSVYQNNVDSTNSTNTTNMGADVDKAKIQVKSSTVSVQPIQTGVIYTRQMPVGQLNLIPQTRGQVFRIATTNSEQISLVKDTVIHSKMSALLAAALQGKPKNSEVATSDDSTGESTGTTTTTRIQLARPTLVQSGRIVKPVLQIPSNVIRSNTPQANLSSTTLEQLREFDMVYKQVKERSSTSTPAEGCSTANESTESSPQRISVTYLNQQGQKLNCAPVVVVSSYSNLQQAASPALSVASQGSSSPCVTPAPTPTPVLPKVVAAAVKSSKGKTVKNAPIHAASKTSPIPKPQQKPQEDEHTTQRIFDILAEYAEQLRNSPDLNNKPAPRRRSNPPTNPNQNSKRKKSSSSKKSGGCSSLSTDVDLDDPRTVGSEDSSCGVVQLSMQDDEQTPTAASTSESNDSTVNTRQQLILTDSSHNQTRNLIIADSSVGEALKMPNTAVLVPGNYIMPVSMVKGGQQIAVVSGGSKILATVPARSGPNMLLFQSFLNQNRKTNVPTVKYSTLQPISGISSQTLTGVTAQPPVILPPPSHGISTVTLGQPIAIKKIDESDRINTELLLTISQSRENNCTTTEDAPQPDSSTNVVPKIESVDLDENTAMSDSSEKTFSYHKPLITTAPIATPVIAQAIKEEASNEQTESTTTQTIMTLNINPLESKGETVKAEDRVQSVLVTAGSSNGPMLSHSPPQYKQSDSNVEQNKDAFLRNGGKRDEKPACVFAMHGKHGRKASYRMDKEVQQICMQRRQAAIERELRLQKSLSEECEDLGVDEPSTSDLFPEALLFDSNNSPSFDQSHDLLKRSTQSQDKEESNKLTLFSDDDFMFEPTEYQTSDNQLCYDEDRRMLTNGQGSAISSCEDSTLLQTCTSMSDVTLCSPISPERYHANTPPPLNKYMHKYTNKKKNERLKQADNWPAEVSSSEDTTGSNELGKCVNSPDVCLNKRSDEELSDGSFKVVRLSITKKECSEVHCSEDPDSLSGRGARKSVKKLCSCCNGSEENPSRKRPASTHPHNTNPHKKAFPNKKR